MSDSHDGDEVPQGLRFSQLYIDRGRGHRDSVRFRKRLYAAAKPYLAEDDSDIADAIERLVGVTVPPGPYSHIWRTFFEECAVRDLLDSITVIWKVMRTSEQRHWQSSVAAIMREEGMGYRVDPLGGVHFAVDEDFEATRQTAVGALGSPRYAAALAAFEGGHRALDSEPPDTRGAIRSIFEACEVVFRLILGDAVARLGSGEINSKLKPRAIEDAGPIHKDAVGGLLRTFAAWVDGAHLYRHGQEVEEHSPPPTRMAVASIQTGTAFLRWLVDFDRAQIERAKRA